MDRSQVTTKGGPPADPPLGKPYISPVGGRHAGRLYPIVPGEPRLLGRSAECNPRFPGALRVSNLHAEVSADAEGRVWLRDMSKNGTSVAGRLVHRERVELRHGDWIVLGEEEQTLRAEWLSDEEVAVRLMPYIDALTGVGTRRHVETRLADVLDSREDMREPLSAVMVDLDHFGRFNKSHGQTTGDEVLRAVGACMRETVRELHPAGNTARHGGEEFVFLLPRCGLEKAVEIAEECRKRIERLELTRSGHRLTITASFGVASCSPVAGMSLEVLVDLADAHVRRAKVGGRNRTCWPGDGTPALECP